MSRHCEREGCGTPISGRRRYCCDRCKLVVGQQRYRARLKDRSHVCARPGCRRYVPLKRAGSEFCSERCEERMNDPRPPCQREGCDNLVPVGRRKFCSTPCSKRATRNRASRERFGGGTETTFDELLTSRYQAKFMKPKYRQCLICGRKFWSDGPWNRVCEKAKCQAKREALVEVYHGVGEE